MPKLLKSLAAAVLRLTTSLRGDEPPTVFRGANLVLRGPLDSPYFEAYGGSRDLHEDYDLSDYLIAGAVSFTAGDHTVSGIGTDFANELHLGQLLLVGTEVLDVKEVTADNEFITERAPSTTSLAGVFLDSAINDVDDTITITAHGFSTGDAVVIIGVGVLPSPLVAGTIYFVHTVDANKIMLATTKAFSASALDAININWGLGVSVGATFHISLVALRLPQLFEILKQRGVQLTGSAIEFEKGHIISVGSGELFLNGESVPGSGLVATNRPQIAIYDPSTGNYTAIPLGYDDPPPPCSIDVITGGTKKMTDGDKHSFMVAWWSGTPLGSGGYSNFCDPIKLDSGGNPLAIANPNNLFEFDFTTVLAGTIPDNAMGFVIAGNLGGKKTKTISGESLAITSPNETLYENGPWFIVKKVLFTDLDMSDKTTVEYLDEDPTIGAEVTGNNEPPPDSEFVTMMEGRPAFVSCFGKLTTSNDQGSNPGKSVVLGKSGNPDGAPAEWSAKLKNIIVGFFEHVGRWFMLTPATLDFVVPTGLQGQSTGGLDDLELPIIYRPYWKTGASNRYSVAGVGVDDLMGFSGGKIFTSVGNADENVRKYDIGTAIADFTRTWFSTRVMVAEDPRNSQACFFYSASHKNTAGYWVSIIQPWSLDRAAWLPWIVLSDDTRDMIVSGVATVDQRLEFLAGGRVAGGTFETSTYRFDGFEDGELSTVTSMPWYLVWQPSDDGLEDLQKMVHSVRPQGRFALGLTVGVYGCKPGGELIISDMENGTNAIGGDIAFYASAEITRYLKVKTRVGNLANYALRAAGEWDGMGDRDRLDELVVEVGSHGRRR